MAESQLTLTPEEHDYLVEVLTEMLKEKRVEEHRTRALSYRGFVVREEELISSLLGKLGHPPR